MNAAALFDGVLALVAFAVAVYGGRSAAVRLGAVLLGCAAALGSLRFSGLLVLPELHQFASALGGAVGLPLLAIVAVWPAGGVATQRRYTWIFAVTAGAACVLVVVVGGFKLWASAWALLSALAMLAVGLRRRQPLGIAAAACLLAAFAAFLSQLRVLDLQAGDWLHIGMAAGLALYARWFRANLRA